MDKNKPEIIVGRTEVRVKKAVETPNGTSFKEIHHGVVVQDNGAFVRVFNYAPLDEGGDTCPQNSEFFPLSSPKCWVEVVKTRKVEEAFVVPAELKF